MAYKQKKPTFFSSALKQAHWYKIDGKPVTKEEYVNYKNEPGKMEGGGKTTNDPDASGHKAAIERARSQNEASQRPTVLTKEQTELLKERTNKKPPLKATAGYEMLMAGAGGQKYSKDSKTGKTKRSGVGSGYYTSGDRSYRLNYNTDVMLEAGKPKKKQTEDSNKGNNGDKGDNTSSSLDIKWPKLFKKRTTQKQKDYNTTACPNFSKGTNPSDPSGFGAGMGFRKMKKRRGPFWNKEN